MRVADQMFVDAFTCRRLQGSRGHQRHCRAHEDQYSSPLPQPEGMSDAF